MARWPRMMAASPAGLAWAALSEGTAQTVSRDHFFFRLSRRRRTIWMAWAACGKASPAATAVTLRVRRSARPCPRSRVSSAVQDLPPGQGCELGEHGVLVALDQEGDRLRRFRALLPCEVVVTAVTHPLHGCRVRAYAFRHVDGVPHLKVELPDGMPGLVAAEATDVFGAGQAGAGTGLDWKRTRLDSSH